MMMAMPSIAWPVWFSVVLAIETMSWKPIATASELFLVRFRYWLVIGGMITRSACGSTIWRSIGAAAQASAPRRLPLAERHRLDAGADDLGDVGGGVDRPGRAAARRYSGLIVPPPWKLKPRSAGMSRSNGAPSAAQTASGRPISRPVPPARRAAARRLPPAGDARGGSTATVPTTPRTKRQHGPGMGRLPDQHRQLHAAVGQEDDVADVQRLTRRAAGSAAACTRTAVAAAAGCRAASRHRTPVSFASSQLLDSRPMPISVPRMVASTMPIDRDLQRVQDADEQRAAIGVDRRIVGDQRFADRNAGDAVEEAEAGGDVPRGQVPVGVADQIPGDQHDQADDDTCQTMARNSGSDHEASAACAPFRWRIRPACRCHAPDHSAGVHRIGGRCRATSTPVTRPRGAAQRIGGAYCRPPLVQMLLMPRGTPIGVMLRSHISPKLPTCLMTL